MGRFERHETGADGPAAALENAADELTSSVERTLREIVEGAQARAAEIEAAAEARAAEIEESAARKADEIRRASEGRAEEVLRAALDRASRMLGAIDAADEKLGSTISALRSESQALASGLEQARLQVSQIEDGAIPPARSEDEPQSAALAEGTAEETADVSDEQIPELNARGEERAAGGDASAEQDEEPEGQVEELDEPDEEPDEPHEPDEALDELDEAPDVNNEEHGEQVPESDGQANSPRLEHASSDQAAPAPREQGADSAEIRGMIREQIMRMYRSGRSRAEAERFLMRFNQGESYMSLVDAIYGDGQGGTDKGRGILGLRRRQR